MASINLGVVGCIAASASSGGSAPTGVSIAENASSGQDDAFRIVESRDVFTVAYSDWTSATSESFGTQYEKEISSGDLGDYDADGFIRCDAYAYLRATGATSYSWSGSVYSSSVAPGITVTTAGAGGGGQDGTSGVGIRFEIYPGTAKGGGNLWPQNGDNVIYKLTGTATNSDGSTSADLYLRYDFTA